MKSSFYIRFALFYLATHLSACKVSKHNYSLFDDLIKVCLPENYLVSTNKDDKKYILTIDSPDTVYLFQNSKSELDFFLYRKWTNSKNVSDLDVRQKIQDLDQNIYKSTPLIMIDTTLNGIKYLGAFYGFNSKKNNCNFEGQIYFIKEPSFLFTLTFNSTNCDSSFLRKETLTLLKNINF